MSGSHGPLEGSNERKSPPLEAAADLYWCIPLKSAGKDGAGNGVKALWFGHGLYLLQASMGWMDGWRPKLLM